MSSSAAPPAREDQETADTYQKPAHGWTCFHCGDTFTTFGSARDHFGATPAEVPGCIIKAGHERHLLMELRKAQAREAELQLERDSLSDQLEAALLSKQDVLRLVKGARTSYDVQCYVETLFGRAQASEEVLKSIEAEQPSLVQKAMVAVCGPGSYFPVGSGIPLERPGQELQNLLAAALSLIDSEFEGWWEAHGQYVRAGGGQYESTFAYRAWEAALKQAAFKLKVAAQGKDLAVHVAENDAVRELAGTLAGVPQAQQVCATVRGALELMAQLKRTAQEQELPSMVAAIRELRQVLALFTPVVQG